MIKKFKITILVVISIILAPLILIFAPYISEGFKSTTSKTNSEIEANALRTTSCIVPMMMR